MTIKPEKADDDVDAFDALESEEKEFIKVSNPFCPTVVLGLLIASYYRMPKLIVF
jgi:hypothetical protein